MTAVQDVEAAVGEADAQALGAPAGDLLGHPLDRRHLALGGVGVRRERGLDEFVGRDGGGPGLADRHARGELGEGDGVFDRGVGRDRQAQGRQCGVARAGLFQ